MKSRFVVLKFKVTETCNNGNERRITKEVYTPIFENNKNIPLEIRINRSIKSLEEQYYYNIEFIGYYNKDLIVI